MSSRFRKLTNASGGGVTGLTGATGGTAIADNAVVRGDGPTGIQGSGIFINDSNLLQFGGTTSSFPAIKLHDSGGANIDVVKADSSTSGAIWAVNFLARNNTTGVARAVLTDPNGTNSPVLGIASTNGIGWSSNTTDGSQAKDTGLYRVAAGVLGVSDGANNSNGWIRDIGKKRVTGNETVTNSIALVDSAFLTVSVAAGRTYQFRCWLPFTTINTSGAKVAISGTATHTDIIYDVTFFGISTPGFLTSGRATAKDTAVGVTASGTACYALIEGTTTINAAGTFLVQFAQNAETGAAESVILLRGATMTLTDVA